MQSLVAIHQVLAMMDANPGDVQRLDGAFLAEPSAVMNRVQFMRKKAQEASNLKANEQQKVTTQTENSKQVIIIEPTQPQTVYVPVYQPVSNRQISGNNNNFKHNAERRKDVPYRDAKSREPRAASSLASSSRPVPRTGPPSKARTANGMRIARAADTLKERGADPVAGREKLQGAELGRLEPGQQPSGRQQYCVVGCA